MAKIGGCNDMMYGKAGMKSTRMDPAKFERNNMAKGGVNKHLGGTDEMGKKPGLAAGANGTGKYKHDKR